MAGCRLIHALGLMVPEELGVEQQFFYIFKARIG